MCHETQRFILLPIYIYVYSSIREAAKNISFFSGLSTYMGEEFGG